MKYTDGEQIEMRAKGKHGRSRKNPEREGKIVESKDSPGYDCSVIWSGWVGRRRAMKRGQPEESLN